MALAATRAAILATMLALLCASTVAVAGAASLFPPADVRLTAGPFLDAQRTDLRYLLAMDADRLLAPFLREAGLAPRQPAYGNWESSGLDGHMGGHYLSALALMWAATGDAEVKRRLDYFVAELKRCQQANGDGYIGGVPGGVAMWREIGADLQTAAQFFWQTVVDKRTVAIGGNSVKEHFHGDADFSPMVNEVEGPETCNTYNMLKLTEMLFLTDPAGRYTDYYERALYNHILASQRPDTGGFVYFTPMRPNHYRVYSQPEQAMWCCVGSGLESQAKYAEFIYAHDADTLYLNLFIASTLNWREKQIRLTQSTRFPDQGASRITLDTPGRFPLKLRYPAWVAPGALTLRLNGRPLRADAQGGFITIARAWRKGDALDITLPMRTTLEQMPDKSNYYALLHGPIVLAAKTHPSPGEQLNVFADDTRMGHIPQGPTCPQAAAPLLVNDAGGFLERVKAVDGKALTFTAPGAVDGGDGDATVFIPFFRLHDARYMVYWPIATSSNLLRVRADLGAAEAERIAKQSRAERAFKGNGAEAGAADAKH